MRRRKHEDFVGEVVMPAVLGAALLILLYSAAKGCT